MTDVEFRPDQEISSSSYTGPVEKNGAVTRLFIKLSFGKIRNTRQANNIMVIVIILSFTISAYLFFV